MAKQERKSNLIDDLLHSLESKRGPLSSLHPTIIRFAKLAVDLRNDISRVVRDEMDLKHSDAAARSHPLDADPLHIVIDKDEVSARVMIVHTPSGLTDGATRATEEEARSVAMDRLLERLETIGG